MTEHTIACRHGQTGECAACSDERYDELARLRAERDALLGGDPLATAYRMGRAQAQDEARLDQKFCPHCNPCRRAEEITKAEAERDAARATLKEICAEWNEGCDPACDSAGHSPTCKATSIAVAKRALQADLDEARALFERGCYNLMLMMQAYERRVRSDCTTPEQISARPWECAEYVEASRYLRKVWPDDAVLQEGGK